jgi:hypothetical protein
MELLSKNDICNLALSRLKIRAKLNLDDPSTAEEVACNRWYDLTRRNAIVDGQPNFSKCKAYLLPIKVDEKNFNYSSVYLLPNDCLKFLYAGTDAGNKIDTELIGENIYTHTFGKLPINYLKDEENTNKYTSKFVEFFSLYLACSLCMELEGYSSLFSSLYELKFKTLNELRIHERQSNKPKLINKKRFNFS